MPAGCACLGAGALAPLGPARIALFGARLPDLALLAEADQAALSAPEADIPDERLRLIFTCCHPALDLKSRVALTLRTLGGLTTAEIAHAFLDREPTMGQRLSRARARIRDAGIPFAVPGPEDWDARLSGVLSVLYLIFNEGYAASAGETRIRSDLCEEALWLGRMLLALRPDEPEVLGLLSLMLTSHARRMARTGDGGDLVPLDRQNRALWDRAMLDEGLSLLDRALGRLAPGPFQIKAAISALHRQAADHAGTDWRQMLLLYDALLRHEPSDVVRLNRAVVLAELAGPARALDEIEALRPALDAYQPLHAARAEMLARLGRTEAVAAYDRAISLSGTPAERAFLAGRQEAQKKKSRAQGPA